MDIEMDKKMGVVVLIADSKRSGKLLKTLYPDLLKDARVFTMADHRGLEGVRVSRVFVEHGCDRWNNAAFCEARRTLSVMSGSSGWHADPEPIVLRMD